MCFAFQAPEEEKEEKDKFSCFSSSSLKTKTNLLSNYDNLLFINFYKMFYLHKSLIKKIKKTLK